jgi:hypothetical protein
VAAEPILPAVLADVDTFLISKRLVDRSKIDALFAARSTDDASALIRQLAVLGHVTKVQAEGMIAEFHQRQMTTARRVIKTARAKGLVPVSHVEQAIASYEPMVFEVSIHDHLVGSGLLTREQADALYHGTLRRRSTITRVAVIAALAVATAIVVGVVALREETLEKRAEAEFASWIGSDFCSEVPGCHPKSCITEVVSDGRLAHVCNLILGTASVGVTYDRRVKRADSATLVLGSLDRTAGHGQETKLVSSFLQNVARSVLAVKTVADDVQDTVVLGASMRLCFAGKLPAGRGFQHNYGPQTITGECDHQRSFWISARPPVRP